MGRIRSGIRQAVLAGTVAALIMRLRKNRAENEKLNRQLVKLATCLLPWEIEQARGTAKKRKKPIHKARGSAY